jgi:hypothetical protein
MTIIRTMTAIAVMLAACAPALAATHSFTLNNFTSVDVTRVTVTDGKVLGFKRVLSKNSLTFQVEFPDGKCISKNLRITFSNGTKTVFANYNVCKDGGVTVVGR